MDAKLRLDEYSYVRRGNSDDIPFVDIIFKYDDEYTITFRVEDKTMEMSVSQYVPVHIVEEAIEEVKNKLLDYYEHTLKS